MPHVAPEQAVDRILRELRLEHVSDVMVGYVEGEDGDGGSATATTQLSGGQRKRVSIGLDLVQSAHVLRAVDAGISLGTSLESLHAPVDTSISGFADRGNRTAADTQGVLERTNGPLLLLDEPTTGLDAAAAWSLMSTLSALTQHGVTLLAALHQPRREIWEAVQHVILMAPAGGLPKQDSTGSSQHRVGGVAYCGPRELAVEYFCALGLEYDLVKPHPYACEADWLLDVVHGIVLPPGEVQVIDFPALWAEHGQTVLASLHASRAPNRATPDANLITPAPAARATGEAAEGGSAASQDPLVIHPAAPVVSEVSAQPVLPATPSLPPRPRPCADVANWLNQAALAMYRTHVVRMRDAHALVLYMAIYTLSALVLSTGFTVYLQGSYASTWVAPMHPSMLAFIPPIVRARAGMNAWDVPLQQLLFFLSSMVGSAAGLGSIAVFGARSALLARDSAAGLSVTAQACGAMAAEILPLVWGASIFTGIWMLFAMPGPWWWWFSVVFGVAWSASGLAYVVSSLTRPTNAAVLLTLLYTMSSVLSGVEPHLTVVRSAGPRGSSIGLEALWYLSYATWAAEGAYCAWTRHTTLAMHQGASLQADVVQTGADLYGYSVQSPLRACLCLAALGILWRVVAVIAQVWSSRAGMAGARTRVQLLDAQSEGQSVNVQGCSVQAPSTLRVKVETQAATSTEESSERTKAALARDAEAEESAAGTDPDAGSDANTRTEDDSSLCASVPGLAFQLAEDAAGTA